MKKLSFFFLLATVLFSAQNQRFAYQYKYIPDSTELSNVQTEMMNLDIAAKGSKFYSSVQQVADSLVDININLPSGNTDLTGIKFGKVKEVVEKMYPDYNIYLYQGLSNDLYKVTEERKIVWKILPEKEKIGDWETQKATTKMFGRIWTAWFAPSIPFQDGPYKFHGLPGLIVKISDQNNTHIFELKAVKNLTKDQEWKIYGEKDSYQKPIPLKQDRFKEAFTKFRANPISKIRQMMNQSGVTISIKDQNGKPLDMNKQVADEEKKMKEDFHKNSNILELDLLK